MSIVSLLGVLALIVGLWDKFGTRRYHPFRACVFIVFVLSGIAPATHYAIQNGWEKSINEAAMGWQVFMDFLYITGTLLYAFRIPERFFPGKVDILVIFTYLLFYTVYWFERSACAARPAL
jgi:adiponectin receptor